MLFFKDIMIQLYKKNIWNDTKTVNVIATACSSKFPKVKVTALKFFVGKDPEQKDSDDSDSDEVEFILKATLVHSVNIKYFSGGKTDH